MEKTKQNKEKHKVGPGQIYFDTPEVRSKDKMESGRGRENGKETAREMKAYKPTPGIPLPPPPFPSPSPSLPKVKRKRKTRLVCSLHSKSSGGDDVLLERGGSRARRRSRYVPLTFLPYKLRQIGKTYSFALFSEIRKISTRHRCARDPVPTEASLAHG